MIQIKNPPTRKANFEGDYPIELPRMDARWQAEADQWYFDFRTVLMRQREEIYGFVNDQINDLKETQGDLVKVEEEVDVIQDQITVINNNITNINNTLVSITSGTGKGLVFDPATNTLNAITKDNYTVGALVYADSTSTLAFLNTKGILQMDGGNPPTTLNGIPGYFPYWDDDSPYLTPTSTVFTDGVYTGVGRDTGIAPVVSPNTTLHVWIQDFTNNSVIDVFKIQHDAIAGSTTGSGTGLLFAGSSDTTAGREMGRIQTVWSTATDATRTSYISVQGVKNAGALTDWVRFINGGQGASVLISDDYTNEFTPSDKIHVVSNINAGVRVVGIGTGVDTRFVFQRARGTMAAKTILSNGDFLTRLIGQGWDGSSYLTSVEMRCLVDGVPAAGDVPGAITFWTKGSGVAGVFERVRIANTGNVGIGTTSPQRILHVSATSTSTIAQSRLDKGTDNKHWFFALVTNVTDATSSDWAIGIFNDSFVSLGNLLRVTRAGNVGIHGPGITLEPLARIHTSVNDAVTNATTDVARFSHSSSGTPAAGFGVGITFGLESTTTVEQDAARIQARWTTATDATRAAAMDFQTVDSGVLATKVTILPSGFVGIGQTTPLADLHMERNGSVTTRWTQTPSVNTLGAVTASLDFWNGAFNIAQIQVQAEGTSGTGQILFRIDTTSQTIKDRIIFKGDGKCGFGTITPEATVHISSISSDPFVHAVMLQLDHPNITKGFRINRYSGTTSAFNLQTTLDGVNWNELLAFNVNSGFLGIGESTPLNRIHALVSDAVTNSATVIMRFNHLSSATPTTNFGTSLYFTGKSSTTDKQDMGLWKVIWTTATDASRTSAMEWQTVNSAAALATRMALSGAGGLSVGDASNTMPVGVINAVTGFRVNNIATSGQVLMGNGTNIVLQALPVSTHTILDAAIHTDSVTQTVTRGSLIYGNSTPKWDELVIGANATYLRSNGTDVAWSNLLAAEITGVIPISVGGTNNTTFPTNAVIFFDGTSLTGETAFTYQASGDNQLVLARTMGAASSDLIGYSLLNSTAAAAGAANQQWSPPLIFEGQGWKTNAAAASQAVRYRNYVVTVEGAANPTGYWILERDINNTGTYTELLRADSTGYVRITKDALSSIDTTLGQSVFGLALQNNTAATAVTTTQDAPTIIWKGAAWNSSALSSQDWRWRALMKGVTVAGTTRSYLRIDSGMNGANFGNPVVLSSAGGMSVGALIEAAFGVVSTQVGYQIAGGAASGQFLVGNGTNFVSTVVSSTTFSHALLSATHTDTTAAAVARGAIIVGQGASPTWSRLTIGAANRLLRSDGTDASWAQAVLTTDVTGVLPVANGGTNKSSWTAGSVAFAGAGGTALAETNTTFYWDFTQIRLGIGTNAPATLLHTYLNDAATSAVSTVLTISHDSSAAVAAGYGSRILWKLESSTTADQDAAALDVLWTTATHATRSSAILFSTVNSGTLGERVRIAADGQVGIGTNNPGALLDLGLAGTRAGVLRLAGVTSGNVTIQTDAAAGTWTLTLPVNDGDAGQVLTTNGSGVTSWAAGGSVTPAALTRVDDTNVTLTLGGSPSVALLAATSLTLGWAGLLSTARGGTAHGNYTAGSVIFAGASGTSLTEDTSNFFWDDTNNRLGIGNNAPGVLLDLGLAGTRAGVLRLAGGTSGNVTIEVAAAAGTWTLRLPVNDGTPNQVLQTDGSGVTSWVTPGGGTIGPFTAGSVIFSDGVTPLAEDNANFFWDDTDNQLRLGDTTPAYEARLSVVGSTGTNHLSLIADELDDCALLIKVAADGDLETDIRSVRNLGTASTPAPSLAFWMFTDDASTLRALTITNNAIPNILIGDGTDLPQGAVNGFLYLPRISPGVGNVPNGTPTAHSGQIPCVIDEDNDTFWAYIGGAWKGAVLT